jgi:hypothetical protein
MALFNHTAPPIKIYSTHLQHLLDSALPTSLLPYIWRVLYRRQPLLAHKRLLSVATGKSHAEAANGR